jgi:hypothetical protein
MKEIYNSIILQYSYIWNLYGRLEALVINIIKKW